VGKFEIQTGIILSVDTGYTVLHIEKQTTVKKACRRRATGFPEFTGNIWKRVQRVSPT
jgi:hypothetical protein